MNIGTIIRIYMYIYLYIYILGVYGDYYRNPVPHSPLSTSKQQEVRCSGTFSDNPWATMGRICWDVDFRIHCVTVAWVYLHMLLYTEPKKD